MSYSRHRPINKPKPGCFIDPLHPLSRGLMLHWLMNEGAGYTAFDLSPRRNHGRIINVDPAVGWIGSTHGGALKCDGTNDYVISTYLVNIPLVTLSAWVNIGSLPAVNGLIAGFVDGIGGGAYDKDLVINASGQVVFHCYDGSGRDTSPLLTISLGQWVHLVGVADGAQAILYCNGIAVASVVCGNTYGSYTVPNVFASGSTSSYAYIQIMVDDVRLYNRSLPPNEIMQLYTDPYANILSPQYRRYFIPAAVGGLSIPVAMAQYRQRWR